MLQPNLPVKPMTLFVNKATVEAGNDRHAQLTWGAAQAGVAGGVADALRSRLHRGDADEMVCVVAVWVNPAADDEEAVYANNRAATTAALSNGQAGLPTTASVLDAGEPENPYFRPNEA